MLREKNQGKKKQEIVGKPTHYNFNYICLFFPVLFLYCIFSHLKLDKRNEQSFDYILNTGSHPCSASFFFCGSSSKL